MDYLKNSVAAWQKYPSSNFGLEQILYRNGLRELWEWYGATLKDILGRAGDLPLDLPKLGELRTLAGKPKWVHDPAMRPMATGEAENTQFAPRVALASLVEWDGTFLEEDERLVGMENSLRDVERLWRREDLFMLWELLRSVTPTAIGRREECGRALSAAQSEFVAALNARGPGIGDAYKHSRDTYHEIMFVILGIDRSGVLRDGRSQRSRLFDAFFQSSRNPYMTRYADHPERLWFSFAEVWTDPAHKDWVHHWTESERWEYGFAYELTTGRKLPDY